MNNGPLFQLMKRYKKLFIIEGILFTLFGIFAILLPKLFSLTLDYFIAWLFILSSGAIAFGSMQGEELPNRKVSIISAILYFVLGVLLLIYPMSGILTLTLLLAFYFMFDGIAKLYSSTQIKPLKGWGWLVLSAIISLALAMLILAFWPGEASWMLGMLVGINLLITGITTLIFVSYLTE